MRASRLVNLLLLLQSRGGLTAAELAQELEVSVRTIHRDVEELSAAGVPIFAERGPLGGIRLVDGYRTRLTGMTADEAEALFLSGLPGPAAQLGLGTVVAAAQLKVMAALPPELRSRASRLVQRFHLDAAGWFQANEPVPHLETLSTGVWDGARSGSRLRPWRRSRRAGARAARARPQGRHLVCDRARRRPDPDVPGVPRGCRDDPRRTGRSTRGFRPGGLLGGVECGVRTGGADVLIEVRVREDQQWRINQVFGRGTVAAAERVDEDDHAGTVRLRLRLGYPDEAPGMLLAVGPNLEVIGPPEVREKVVMLATRIADRYREVAPVDAAR